MNRTTPAKGTIQDYPWPEYVYSAHQLPSPSLQQQSPMQVERGSMLDSIFQRIARIKPQLNSTPSPGSPPSPQSPRSPLSTRSPHADHAVSYHSHPQSLPLTDSNSGGAGVRNERPAWWPSRQAQERELEIGSDHHPTQRGGYGTLANIPFRRTLPQDPIEEEVAPNPSYRAGSGNRHARAPERDEESEESRKWRWEETESRNGEFQRRQEERNRHHGITKRNGVGMDLRTHFEPEDTSGDFDLALRYAMEGMSYSPPPSPTPHTASNRSAGDFDMEGEEEQMEAMRRFESDREMALRMSMEDEEMTTTLLGLKDEGFEVPDFVEPPPVPPKERKVSSEFEMAMPGGWQDERGKGKGKGKQRAEQSEEEYPALWTRTALRPDKELEGKPKTTCQICFDPFISVPQPYEQMFDFIPFASRLTIHSQPHLHRAGTSRGTQEGKTAMVGSILPTCNHSFCISCLTEYIDSKLADPNPFPIRCPFPKCETRIDDSMAEKVLGRENMDVWHFKALVESTPKIYCPFKSCSHPVTIVEGTTRATCPNCRKEVCWACRTEWHDGYTCAQFKNLPPRETKDDDETFRRFVAMKKWQKCPHCGNVVEKSSGCDHMSCRCKKEWCYRCGGDYRNGCLTRGCR
ncbi:hypothetical protein BT69DRAFT_115029 [Atractiella rhizophila]|nr:hypothetical protein BT69DRAFT_115029 [Atractiella rhizophila]